MGSDLVKTFIGRWSAATASERANSQPFLCELCDFLDVPRPEPVKENGYALEFDVTEHHPDGTTTKGRIDLYRRGSRRPPPRPFEISNLKFAIRPLHPPLGGVNVATMKRKESSAAGSRSDNAPKWRVIQTYLITCSSLGRRSPAPARLCLLPVSARRAKTKLSARKRPEYSPQSRKIDSERRNKLTNNDKARPFLTR